MPGLFSNDTTDLAILADLVGVGGLFNGSLVQLVKEDFEDGDRLLIRTDFEDADYTGEGQEAITWGVPSIADDGTPEVVGLVGEFRPTGSVIVNTIFGGIIVTAVDALQLAFKLSEPAPMQTVRDSIILTLRLRLTPSGLVVEVT